MSLARTSVSTWTWPPGAADVAAHNSWLFWEEGQHQDGTKGRD